MYVGLLKKDEGTKATMYIPINSDFLFTSIDRLNKHYADYFEKKELYVGKHEEYLNEDGSTEVRIRAVPYNEVALLLKLEELFGYEALMKLG